MKPEQLTSWALHESPTDEARLVQAALQADPALAADAEDIRSFAEMIKKELRPADAGLTDVQRDALKQRFLAVPRQTIQAPSLLPRRVLKVVAVAACMTLGLFFALRSPREIEPFEPVVVRKASSSGDVKVMIKLADTKPAETIAVGAAALAAILNDAATGALPAPRDGALDEPRRTEDRGQLASGIGEAFPLSPTGAFFSVSQAPFSQFPVDAQHVSLAATLSEDLRHILGGHGELRPSAEQMAVSAEAHASPWSETHILARVGLMGPTSGVAREVNVTVEFNPARVGSYRLIGYQNQSVKGTPTGNRLQRGEVHPGQVVTAIYEVIPTRGNSVPSGNVPKYQAPRVATADLSDELLTVKLRYVPPTGGPMALIEQALVHHR
jgi:hypothetical protein